MTAFLASVTFIFLLAPCLGNLLLQPFLSGTLGVGASRPCRYGLSLGLGILAEGLCTMVCALTLCRYWPLAVVNSIALVWQLRHRPILNKPERFTPVQLLAGLAVANSFLLLLLFWANFPFGNMDAFSMWMLKARFLFEGGANWHHLFNPALPNAEYPILYPAIIASAWFACGHVSFFAVCLLQIAFLLATYLLVYDGVKRYSSSPQACVAVVFVASNVYLIYRASCLYAELPLIFVFTAICHRILQFSQPSKHDAVFLGLLGGLGVCLKQEGVLFLGLTGVLYSLALINVSLKARIKHCVLLLLATLPTIGVHILTQVLYRQSDPALTPSSQSVLLHLTSPDRYIPVLTSLVTILVNPKWWGFLGILPLLLLPRLIRHGRRPQIVACALAVAQTTVLTAYFVLTPLDQMNHLETAHERLILQSWPALMMTTMAFL